MAHKTDSALPNANLREIAGRIQGLSYRDMQALCKAFMGQAGAAQSFLRGVDLPEVFLDMAGVLADAVVGG